LAIVLASWIEGRFILPESNLIDFRGLPEAAAEEVRSLWALGQRPIKNTVHLLEANGVRVFSLAEDCREVDAFSFWHNSTAFIFLNTFKSGEHSRFDAMHELGHLVMHRHGGPDGRVAEQEADAFASAMLMPRDDVLAHAPRLATLPVLIQLKKRWIVALSALNYRLHTLCLTTDWQYRTLCIQISESGYRKNEPEPCARETSQVLEKVFTILRSEGVMRGDIATELCLRTEDLDALIFGLVPGNDGGKKDGPIGLNSRRHLRIVTNDI
jgi:Zn-dependent peptidase ImmA (M78 family)